MNSVDVVVVGGGPAGLSAAISAGLAGARTLLLDEQTELGGQLRYRIAEVRDHSGETIRAQVLRQRLVTECLAAGVEVVTGAAVWGGFAGNRLGLVAGRSSVVIEAREIVLATGSTDLPLPFPGGSLPGVMTARAAQILLHVHRVRPGVRAAVVGDSIEATEVAADLRLVGIDVVELPVRPNLNAGGDDDGVAWVQSRQVRYDIDLIVVAVGRQPDAQLAFMLEADAMRSEVAAYFVPVRFADGATSVPGLRVCGDAATPCDVAEALAEGALAGAAAAAAAGCSVDIDPFRERLAALTPTRDHVQPTSHATPHLSWKGMTSA